MRIVVVILRVGVGVVSIINVVNSRLSIVVIDNLFKLIFNLEAGHAFLLGKGFDSSNHKRCDRHLCNFLCSHFTAGGDIQNVVAGCRTFHGS